MKHVKTAVKVIKPRGSSWWIWQVVGSRGHVYASGAKRTQLEALQAGRHALNMLRYCKAGALARQAKSEAFKRLHRPVEGVIWHDPVLSIGNAAKREDPHGGALRGAQVAPERWRGVRRPKLAGSASSERKARTYPHGTGGLN